MANAWHEFAIAIQSRLTGDATLVALLGTATAVMQVIPKFAAASQYPFIVWNRTSMVPQDGFKLNMDVVDFDVQVRLESKNKYGSDTPMVRMDSIVKRVKGDWEEQATRVPSYGLDRYAIGALGSTGYTADSIFRTGGPFNVQADDVLAEALSFRCHINKAGA